MTGLLLCEPCIKSAVRTTCHKCILTIEMDGNYDTLQRLCSHYVHCQTSSWLLTGKSFTRTASRALSAASSWRVCTAARPGSITARAATWPSSGKNAPDARKSGWYSYSTYFIYFFSPGYSWWRPEVWRTKLPPDLLQVLSLRPGAGPGSGAQHQGGQNKIKTFFSLLTFYPSTRGSRLVESVMTTSSKRSVQCAIKLLQVSQLVTVK